MTLPGASYILPIGGFGLQLAEVKSYRDPIVAKAANQGGKLAYVRRFGNRYHRWGGFSALELALAILILSIMTIIGMVSLRMAGQYDRVHQSASRLQHAFSVARSMAIANNSTYTVWIDMTHHNFWVDETYMNGQTIAAKVVHPQLLEANVAIDTFIYGTVTTNIEAVRPVRFFADGSCDDVTIMLRNDGDSASNPKNIDTIRVYGPTGQTRLFENERREPTTSPLI